MERTNKPNVIVDKVKGLSSLTKAAVAPEKMSVDVIEVNFGGGRLGKLDLKDHMSGVWAKVLDNMHKLNQPVYVEIDPQTDFITKVLLPMSVKVGRIMALDNGDLEVHLEISAARHYLRQSNPDFQKLFEALKKAKDENEDLLVTENINTHEIMDIRPNSNSLVSIEALAPQPVGKVQQLVQKITYEKAQELFNLFVNNTCKSPDSSEPLCIPFLYPDDGCWARAHEMCYLIRIEGIESQKIWSYPDPQKKNSILKVKTDNSPKCEVDWSYHVAPCVQVSGKGYIVLDPSIFNSPVDINTWLKEQYLHENELPEGIITDAWVYYRSITPNMLPKDYQPIYDTSNYDETLKSLQKYRQNFYIRQTLDCDGSVPEDPEDELGKPPYCVKCKNRPTLTVNLVAGKSGRMFNFEGNKYTPNGVVNLSLSGTKTSRQSLLLTASNSGDISSQYPNTAGNGQYVFWAIDKSTGKKSNTFQLVVP